MPRFYIPPAAWRPDRLVLAEEEAHHARQVLRLKTGDQATVFNGQGEAATVRIDEPAGRKLPLTPLQFIQTPLLPCQITLGQAIPKGKTMDLIVQKAVELGVSQIVPLMTERTIVLLESSEIGAKKEKWQRTALEACKQCGRNWLPEIAVPSSFSPFIHTVQDDFDLILIAALTSEAKSLRAHLQSYRDNGERPLPERLLLLIGPEGDFARNELTEAAQAGARALSLGPNVLRSETAALYGLSVLGYELFGS